MNILICYLWIALLACLSLPAAAADKVAFVVGNGSYQHTQALPNPENDAADIATSLRQLGFEVVLATNVDKAGFDRKAREFASALRDARLALFFYAGHGLQVAGKNYVLPIDAKLQGPADLVVEAIDVDQILAIMQSDEKRVNLVFLDACRDNPLSQSFARGLPASRTLSVGTGLSTLETARGTLIAYATSPNKVAIDGSGRNSPFTASLLKHIKTPNVDIALIMRRVTADVEAATNGQQSPWVHASLTSEVMLGGRDSTVTALAVPQSAPAVPCGELDNRIIRAVSAPAPSQEKLIENVLSLRELSQKVAGDCASKGKVFGGPIAKVQKCLNETTYVELGGANGGAFVFTSNTKNYQAGVPSKKGQWVLAIAGPPYYCLASVTPTVVLSATHVTSMTFK